VIARPNVLLLVLVSALLLGTTGCKKKPKPFPPAPQLVSSATTDGASIGAIGAKDAGTVRVVAPANTSSNADRTTLDEAKVIVRDLEAMVKRGSIVNPDKPDDPDANAKCGELESGRARLEALAVADADAKQLVADTKRLCGLEVPILSADKALKQVTISPSQASRQLMCKYTSKDLDKAHKEKASDKRVRDLDARFAKACR
jgi:hypothetical protein